MVRIVHNNKKKILNLVNITINGYLYMLDIQVRIKNYLHSVNLHSINNNKYFKT